MDQKDAIYEMMSVAKPEIRFFVFAYWHDARFKSKAGGPMKVYELTDNLTRRGHQIYLFIPKIGYPEQQTTARVCPVPFIDLPVLRFISFQMLAFLWALCIVLRKDRPDIIYVRIMWSFIPMILGKLLSVPVMLEINDSPHRAYANIKSAFKRNLVHFVDKVSFRLSDHILPVTQNIAENMNHWEKIPWERMTVLPSGTNIDLFKPMDKRQCCHQLGFDYSLIYVGFIGTFFRHQGIDVLIEAAPFVLQEFPQTHFLILGDGPMMETWKQRVEKEDLNACFSFPGNVPYEVVPQYCGVMDVCVAPFLKEAVECSPVKIFDYLACGKPVVATDVGEIGNFFIDSDAVMIIPPEDPAALAQGIKRLLSNAKLCSAMGEKGRAFVVGKYGRMQIAENVEAVALKLLISKA